MQQNSSQRRAPRSHAASLAGAILMLSLGCSESTTPAGDGGSATSDGGGTTAGGSCLVATSSTCYDYVGSLYSNQTGASCAAIGGTFARSACTASGRIGTCRRDAGMPAEQLVRFYAPMTVANAQNTCKFAPGVFTAD